MTFNVHIMVLGFDFFNWYTNQLRKNPTVAYFLSWFMHAQHIVKSSGFNTSFKLSVILRLAQTHCIIYAVELPIYDLFVINLLLFLT